MFPPCCSIASDIDARFIQSAQVICASFQSLLHQIWRVFREAPLVTNVYLDYFGLEVKKILDGLKILAFPDTTRLFPEPSET